MATRDSTTDDSGNGYRNNGHKNNEQNSPKDRLGNPVPVGIADPYRRKGCTKLVFPFNESVSIPNTTIKIGSAIRSILKADTVDTVEFLSFPAVEDQLEAQAFAFSGISDNSYEDSDRSQITFGDSNNSTHSTMTSVVSKELDSSLPSEIGLQRCNIDFSPLGNTAVSTLRLYLSKKRWPTSTENIRYNPLTELLGDLRKKNLPHLYQCLVTKQDSRSRGSYKIAIRLAVFHHRHSLPERKDIARAYYEDYRYNPTGIYNPIGGKFNFDIELEDYFEIWQTLGETFIRARDFVSRQEARRVIRICKGYDEYEKLLQGSPSGSESYTDRLGYPFFGVKPSHLSYFISIPPFSDGRSCWQNTTRKPPQFVDIESIREPTQSSETTRSSDQTESSSDHEQTLIRTGGTRGKKEHGININRVKSLREEQGYEVVAPEQGDSVPDLWERRKDTGKIAANEIEESLSRADSILTNIARNVEAGYPVNLVLGDPSKKERVAKLALEPFKNAKQGMTSLYMDRRSIRIPSGWTVVYPADSECEWCLTPDWDIQYRVDGDIKASGDASTSVTEFEYDLPRYKKQDTQYIVKDSEGNELKTYSSSEALSEDFSETSQPFVPTRRYYCDEITIWYFENGSLKKYEHRPDWYYGHSGVQKRYRAAFEEGFKEQYMTKQEDTEMAKSTFFEEFGNWYHIVTGDEIPPNQRGVVLKNSTDVSITKRNGSEYIEDYTWRYPEGQLSPDHRFVNSNGKMKDISPSFDE